MAKLSITKASEIFAKDRKTIYRHLKQGKLTRDSDGTIDLSELIRAYGEPKNNATNATMGKNEESLHGATSHATPEMGHVLQEQIRDLKKQLEDLREDKDQQVAELRNDKEKLWEELSAKNRLLEDKREKTDLLTELRPSEVDPPGPSVMQTSLNIFLIGGGIVITAALAFMAWVF